MHDARAKLPPALTSECAMLTENTKIKQFADKPVNDSRITTSELPFQGMHRSFVSQHLRLTFAIHILTFSNIA
jgi:hypothetical protein